MATIDYKQKIRDYMNSSEVDTLYKSMLNNLFPELAESEDERIRKALKEYFINSFQNNGVAAICGVHIKDILAFLEKQSEQKPTDKIEPKFKVGNKIKLAKEPKYPAREIIAIRNDAYYFDELVYLPFSRQDEWELVEQKPAETEKGTKGNNGEIPNSTWSDEDEINLEKAIWYVENPAPMVVKDSMLVEWLKPQLDKSYADYGETKMMELTRFDGYAMLDAIEFGAKWKVENLWKPADGDNLPDIDREVIALLDNGKVVFAHRPPEYWDGKNIITGKVTRNYPKTYDKGGWNIPDIKWWLDVELPKEIEL